MAEVLVAGGILVAGCIPLFGYWVKLAKDTGGVTSKARAFRVVQEAVDRFQSLGAEKLLAMVAGDGSLALPAVAATGGAATAAASRFGAALMLGAPAKVPAAKVSSHLTKESSLLRLTVSSADYPELKVERLLPLPVEPAAPAWQ